MSRQDHPAQRHHDARILAELDSPTPSVDTGCAYCGEPEREVAPALCMKCLTAVTATYLKALSTIGYLAERHSYDSTSPAACRSIERRVVGLVSLMNEGAAAVNPAAHLDQASQWERGDFSAWTAVVAVIAGLSEENEALAPSRQRLALLCSVGQRLATEGVRP